LNNVDFTREPIIETIISPRDGCKLVVRSSKSTGQEEYFVDAVEVVSFGQALFFRSLERPKAFLVPVNDYEILEVREARMVLKNIGPDRSIKIGGGRESAVRAPREEKGEVSQPVEELVPAAEQESVAIETTAEARPEVKLDKKRDRRRQYRKRRGGREEAGKEEEIAVEPTIPSLEEERINIPPPEETAETQAAAPLSASLLSSLLQPPPTLISETISRYRENALFKNAFFLTEEEEYKPHNKAHELLNEDDEDLAPPLQEPTYEPLEEGSLEDVSFVEEASNEELFREEINEGEPQEKESEFSMESNALEEEFSQEVSLPLYAEEEEPVLEDESSEEGEKESGGEGEEKILTEENPEDSDYLEKNRNNHQPDLPF
jgi:hypothetical protein